MNFRDSVNSQNKIPDIKVFWKDDWESDCSSFITLANAKRASNCIQHLIANSHLRLRKLNILEAWPLPTSIALASVAPIAILQEDLPENNYLWFWVHLDIIKSNNELNLKDIMWQVEFKEWLFHFDDDRLKGNGAKDILSFFNGRPDIIYGSHVYENSWAKRSTFPVGREWMIEGTARILQEEWYLVIDNAFGYLSQTIWIWTSWKSYYSKHMVHVASYFYDDNQTQAIHIFQKPKWTDEIAKREIAKKDLEELNRELDEYNRKIQGLLNSLKENMSLFERKKEKIPREINKLKISLERIPSSKSDAIWRMNDSILKMTDELEAIPALINQYRQQHAIKIKDLQEERKKISTQINIIFSTID